MRLRLLTAVCVFAFCATQAQAFSILPKKEGVHVTITEAFVEMHSGPGRGYPVLHVVENGERVRIYKSKTDWYKIETESGKTGWVKRRELKETLADDGVIVDFSPMNREELLNKRFSVGVLGGDFDGANGLTAYASWHLTHNIATELKFTEAFGSFSNTKLYSINIVHQTYPKWRISPFVTLGAGIVQISPSSALVQTEDRQDSVITAGAGLIVFSSRNMNLRLEYNNHAVLTNRANNEEVEEWKAGFSVSF
ncbi:MAG: hypothetical protein ACI93R_002380 [Flavobacteriales bacterium]|jgi:uncharacterized protein YgiM (DUF1202 family)